MTVVITKKAAQGFSMLKLIKLKDEILAPSNQSTSSPEEAANVVRPRVPIEASSAYWVAVYVLSTNSEMNATKATVANAAAISSNRTVTAKSNSDFPDHARAANKRFVAAINIPETNIAFTTPERIANKPPRSVNTTVVIQPMPLE